MDNAPTGVITGLTDQHIGHILGVYRDSSAFSALSMRFPDHPISEGAGDPNTVSVSFLDALISAGFVDRRGQGRGRPYLLCLHNWDEYAGRFLQGRAADRERKRLGRAADVRRKSGGSPPLQESTGEYRREDPSSSAPGVEVDDKYGAFCRLYEGNVCTLGPLIADRLAEIAKEFTLEWFEAAVQEAVGSNAHNLKYIEAILERWKREGFKVPLGGIKGRGNGPRPSGGRTPKQLPTAEQLKGSWGGH
jgi:DnaD/phage-associated family protein